MRNVSIGIVLALSGLAWAGNSAVEIEGGGDVRVDLPALREAVAAGGLVRLRGTFDLGENGTLPVSRDLVLAGQTDPSGKPVTRILGGRHVLTVDSGASVAVEGIRFEEARGSVLRVRRARGVRVERCAFFLVRPETGWYPFAGSPFPSAIAISVSGWSLEGSGDPRSVRGEVIVRDSAISLNPSPGFAPEYDAAFSYGIEIDLVRASALVERNDVRNVNSAGIKVVDVLSGTRILGNTIEPGPPQRTALSMGDGIVAGALYDLASPAEGDVEIRRNRITCANPEADGIAVSGRVFATDASSRYVIADNRVHMVDTRHGALTGYWGLENSVWSKNRIEGSMAWAVGIVPGGRSASDTVIVRNDVTDAVTHEADVWLGEGSRRSHVVGKGGSVAAVGSEHLIHGLDRRPDAEAPGDDRWTSLFRKYAWRRGLHPPGSVRLGPDDDLTEDQPDGR